MKLLIDIGNTNTALALVKNRKIVRRYFFYTARKNVKAAALRRLLGLNNKKIETIVIVSVVPEFLKLLILGLNKVFDSVPIIVVGKDLKVPIRVQYEKPKEVGQDRLVAAYAVKHYFGYPSLVIDFGTAVTFDYLNSKGDYEGGLIFPGIRLALGSLINNAALLPNISLRSMRGLIGRNTNDSMNKGIVIGYSSLCDGIIKKFKEKYGDHLKVIATGGDSELIFKYAKASPELSRDLIISGLDLLS